MALYRSITTKHSIPFITTPSRGWAHLAFQAQPKRKELMPNKQNWPLFRTLGDTKQYADFSVVLFRSDSMLVSRENRMKMYKNQ